MLKKLPWDSFSLLSPERLGEEPPGDEEAIETILTGPLDDGGRARWRS